MPPMQPIGLSPVDSDQSGEQTRLKVLWDGQMKNPFKPVRHDKSVVLLLSWSPDCDKLGTKEEVDDLHEVFRDKYGFTVHPRTINGEQPAQAQINFHLAEFVLKHDRSSTLLIIYYAGHGWPDGDELKFVSDTSEEAQKAAAWERTTIVWQSAEANIRKTEGDVLVIFDCCYAGVLCKPERAPPDRCFEYLAACAADKRTPAPSDESFTRALIWALLRLEKENRHFSTSELHQWIYRAPRLPKKQYPILSKRFEPKYDVPPRKQSGDQNANQNSAMHISMAPYNGRVAAITRRKAPEVTINAFLDLRFEFEELNDEVIQQTANALKGIMGKGHNKLIAQRISFKAARQLEEVKKQWAMQWLDAHKRKRSSWQSEKQSTELLMFRKALTPVSDGEHTSLRVPCGTLEEAIPTTPTTPIATFSTATLPPPAEIVARMNGEVVEHCSTPVDITPRLRIVTSASTQASHTAKATPIPSSLASVKRKSSGSETDGSTSSPRRSKRLKS